MAGVYSFKNGEAVVTKTYPNLMVEVKSWTSTRP
jgi:hypothetical protein